MKKNNKRGKYNEKYNLDALENMYSILEKRNYWMTSLHLSKLSGRSHDKVKRDIERDIVNKLQELKDSIPTNKKFKNLNNIDDFVRSIDSCEYKISHYKDSLNRRQTLYVLNREASLLCLARYNYAIQTRINSLFLELYDKENEKIKSELDLYDGENDFMESVAKRFVIKDKDGNSLGRNKLFEILRDYKVLHSNISNWNIPHQMYVKNRYFRILFKEVKNNRTVAVVRITPKGVEFIHNLIRELGYSYDGSLNEMKTFVTNDDYYEEDLDIYK